jgi:hypothetical protein
MIKLMTLILLAIILPSAVAAQNKERHGQGYVFVAPATTSEGGVGLHFGVGGEGLVYKGLGLGAEIGYLGAARELSQGLGIFSPDASYHFLRSGGSGKFSPFVTGGYSRLFTGGGGANAFNIGGGLHWWFKDRIGLRLEVRDHITAPEPSIHIIGFRIGLAFR